MSQFTRDLILDNSAVQNLSVQSLAVRNLAVAGSISGRNVRLGSSATVVPVTVSNAVTLTAAQILSGYVQLTNDGATAGVALTLPVAANLIAAGLAVGDIVECLVFNLTGQIVTPAAYTSSAATILFNTPNPVAPVANLTAVRYIFTVTSSTTVILSASF